MRRSISLSAGLVAVMLLAGILAAGAGCESQRQRTAKPAPQESQRRKAQKRDAHDRRPPDPENMQRVGVRVDPDAPVLMQYLQLTLRSKDLARRTKALSNLRMIAQGVRMFAAANDRFPKSLDELAESGMVPIDALRSPVKGAGRFEYITGLKPSSPPGSILAYDGKVVYAGKCCAVRLDGAAITLSPEQLESQVRETLKRLGR